MTFTVALLQIAPFGTDRNLNLEKGLHFCREARSMGADLAVFPELWSTGGSPQPSLAIDRQSDFIRSFAALAREVRINIAVTYLEANLPKPRNSAAIVNSDGEFVLNYSKVFLCDFGEGPGSQHAGCDTGCSPGESFDVCTLTGTEGNVRVGAMICADREFPEPAAELMRNGAELIVVPNACGWDEIRTAGLKTRAFENLVGVVMANYPAPRNNGQSQACSCVPWKDGRVREMLIAKADGQEQILLAPFDMDEMRAFRSAESWRMQYRLRPPRLPLH